MTERMYVDEKMPEAPSAGHRLDMAVGQLHETISSLEKAIGPILTPDYPVAEVTSIDEGTLLHLTAARLEGQASWLRSIIARVEL